MLRRALLTLKNNKFSTKLFRLIWFNRHLVKINYALPGTLVTDAKRVAPPEGRQFRVWNILKISRLEHSFSPEV